MKALAWLLLLFAAAVGVVWGASSNGGYVLLVLPQWRVELSLNFTILLLGVLFLLAYAGLRLVSWVGSIPRRASAYLQRRRREKSGEVFQDAVRFLFEGRYGQALKRADQAHAAGRAPALAALIAARSAQRLGDPVRQQAWLDKAKAEDARTESATLMLEAEMLIEARDFSAALAVLGRLQGREGRHIAALRLELRAYQGLEDWDGVLKLLRQLAKRNALSPTLVPVLTRQALLGKIAQCAQDGPALRTLLESIPRDERQLPVVLALAESLAAAQETSAAQALIEETAQRGLEGFWESPLIALYGQLSGGDQTARIGQAETWLRSHRHHAGLLLALGRMCARQRLWGKAQSYLEASLGLAQSQAAHLELARLLEQLGQTDAANQHYRAAVAAHNTH